ncbi:MAG: hypothetical protein K8R69_02095 [Deltaproteobacteria bacterium]|nr:hypothetical protein [Deltaproteobacteria bacterium]
MPLIPNLRARRPMLIPVTLEGSRLSASVTEKSFEPTKLGTPARYQLEAEITALPGSRILSITSPSSKVTLQDAPAAIPSINIRKLLVTAKAPGLCDTTNPREPLSLVIDYSIQGKTFRESLDVDYLCLLGDLIPEDSRSTNKKAADFIAGLAKIYQKDPVIQTLLRRAQLFSRGSALEEHRRVMEWVIPEIIDDPHDGAPGWTPGSAYVLSPSESLRFGGDCEDWSILMGAFLSARGLNTEIIYVPAHVWFRAEGVEIDSRRPGLQAPSSIGAEFSWIPK